MCLNSTLLTLMKCTKRTCQVLAFPPGLIFAWVPKDTSKHKEKGARDKRPCGHYSVEGPKECRRL